MNINEDEKIVLIEDNDDHAEAIRDTLVKALKCTKDQVLRMYSTKELPRNIDNLGAQIIAIILDLNLPDSRGIETVTLVRAITAELPIIVLTSTGDEELAVSTLKSGAQDFIIKDDLDHKMMQRILRYAIERKNTENHLNDKIEELERFNALAIGRERRIVELKQDINELLLQKGSKPRFDLSFILEGGG